MTIEKLMEELGKLGLQICYCNPNNKSVISVVKAHIANPLLFFNNLNCGENYDGNIHLKAINIWLYTELETVGAIRLVDEYLRTKPTENKQILN